MAFSDIKPGDVLGAIALLDDPATGPRLLRELHFGQAKSYRLVYDGKFYDSKAVVGIAHGLGAGGQYLTSRDFTGGYRGAAHVLERLGFYVDYQWLYAITRLQVDRTHGRPAAYQYVVLLWAIARAKDGQPRMVGFNDVRVELARLLAPFALAKTAPDPVMPWIALASAPRTWLDYELWELETPSGETATVRESDVRSLNLAAGLSREFYRYITNDVDKNRFTEAAVDVIATLVGSEPGYLPMLQQLGLADRGSGAADEPVEVVDALAAVESVSNPRRSRHRHFTAAQNRAIEERAVSVTREHFERELDFATEDVGKTESYDVRATRGTSVVKIEVKGTTTSGAAVVLTRNEVRLHLNEHPNNALAVVRRIILDHDDDGPCASGGELVLIMPWELDDSGLSAIAYDYRTGL